MPDCAALLGARQLTAVGFFGRPRTDVDQVQIHDLEAGIVDTLETILGVLCYYDLALADGGYGNLILCAAPDSPTHVHTLLCIGVQSSSRRVITTASASTQAWCQGGSLAMSASFSSARATTTSTATRNGSPSATCLE